MIGKDWCVTRARSRLGDGYSEPRQSVAQELTVVSFGGSYRKGRARRSSSLPPRRSASQLKEETYTGIADLRLKVKAGAVTWDVVASGSGSAARAGAEGILEKLDYKTIDVSSFLPGCGRTTASAATCSRPCSPGTRRPTPTRVRRAGPTSGT